MAMVARSLALVVILLVVGFAAAKHKHGPKLTLPGRAKASLIQVLWNNTELKIQNRLYFYYTFNGFNGSTVTNSIAALQAVFTVPPGTPGGQSDSFTNATYVAFFGGVVYNNTKPYSKFGKKSATVPQTVIPGDLFTPFNITISGFTARGSGKKKLVSTCTQTSSKSWIRTIQNAGLYNNYPYFSFYTDYSDKSTYTVVKLKSDITITGTFSDGSGGFSSTIPKDAFVYLYSDLFTYQFLA